MTQIRKQVGSGYWRLEFIWYLDFEIKVTPCLEICWSKIDCWKWGLIFT